MTTTLPAVPGARELTPEEQEERAKICFSLDQRVKAGLRAGRQAMWEVARALHEFDELSGWNALGYDKIGEWLADPEISMTRSSFYRLVSTYRETVVIRQVDYDEVKELDYSKVDVVLPAVKAGKVTWQQARDDAKDLGIRDLREQYYKRPDPADSATQAPTGGTGPDTEPPAPQNPTDDTPVTASDVEPAQNDPSSPSGQVQMADDDDVIEGEAREVVEAGYAEGVSRYEVARELARVMWRVSEEVAPPEKKRMSNDLREDVNAVVKAAIDAGLLDV